MGEADDVNGKKGAACMLLFTTAMVSVNIMVSMVFGLSVGYLMWTLGMVPNLKLAVDGRLL